jgi:hypothetical protein
LSLSFIFSVIVQAPFLSQKTDNAFKLAGGIYYFREDITTIIFCWNFLAFDHIGLTKC